jgi:hypothetical protein
VWIGRVTETAEIGLFRIFAGCRLEKTKSEAKKLKKKKYI